MATAEFNAMTPAQQEQVIRDFITQTYAAGGTNADVAAAMDTYGISPAQVSSAFGNDVAQVQAAYNEVSPGGMFSSVDNTEDNAKTTTLSPPSTPAVGGPVQTSAGVPANVKAALESKNLTQDEYNTLAAYFGNEMVLNEASRDPKKPTIRDFVGKRSGYEFASFLASRGPEQGNTGNASQTYQELISPYQGQEVTYRVETDSETGQNRFYVNDPFTGKEQEVFQQADGTFKGYVGNLSGQEQGAMSDGSFNLGTTYNFDPETGKATIGSPTINYQAPKSGLGGLGMIASVGLGLAFPGLGTALGTSLGLSGAAASAIGNALIGGLTTGAITGDLEKGLVAGALAGLGTYGMESGMIGDAMDSLGLGSYKDTFGIKNTTQLANIGDVEAQAGGFFGNTKNAVYDQATGLTNLYNDDGSLRGYVVDPANNPFNLTPGTYTPSEFQGMLSGTEAGTGLTQAATTNLGTGLKPPTDAGSMLGTGTAAAGTAGGVSGGTGLTPGAGGITGIGAGTAAAAGAGVAGASTLADILKTTVGGVNVGGLLSAGVDYAKLNELQKLANEQGQAIRQEATAAGKLANIPFTPYTVTSGAGTTQFGVDAAGKPTATVTSSPEYQALRQQALERAGQAYGAVNPATATQDYYANLQALQAPGQQIAQEQLLSNLGAKGLLGVGRNMPTVGQTGTSTVNPYMQSLLASQRQADLQNAIASQQYGLQQAQGQAQLAGMLLGQGQNIDTQAMQTLAQGSGLGSTATQLNQAGAAKQLAATLAGMQTGAGYDLAALNAKAQAYGGAATAVKDIFGLPTTSGSTSNIDWSNILNSTRPYTGISYSNGVFY